MQWTTMTDLPTEGSAPAGKDPLATVSLISGILAIFSSCCCGCFTSPLSLIAIVTGAMVVMKGESPSKTMAMGGLGMGVLSILLMVVSSFLSVGSNILSAIMQNM